VTVSTLEAAITQIQTYALTLSGIRAAPAKPPDAVNVTPMAITYPRSGNWEGPSGAWKNGLQTVIVEILIPAKDLPRDVATLMPYAESLPNILLKNPTLNGTVDCIVGKIAWTFGNLGEWAGVMMRGWRFEVTVKMQTALT
jgi:hypothetical protein